MASFPATVSVQVVLLVVLAGLHISSQLQAASFGDPVELQDVLPVGRSVAVQLVATRAGAEVDLSLQGGGAVCGNKITVTGVEDSTGTIYWHTSSRTMATPPRILWTSFRKGNKHRLFIHRRTLALWDAWLEQTPLQVYTFQSPGCPSLFAMMTIASRGATLELIAQEPPRQDNASLAVGEQVLLSAPDGFLQSVGLCGKASCSAVRLHGVTDKRGLAYTTVLTVNGDIDAPGRVLTEHGPWAFFNARRRNTVVVHRRAANVLAVWLQADPLRVATVWTAPDWDQLRFQPEWEVKVHYDTPLPPPTAKVPTTAPTTKATKPSPKATSHAPWPVTTESQQTEPTAAPATAKTTTARPAPERSTAATRTSTNTPTTSGSTVLGGGSMFCLAVTIVFLVQRYNKETCVLIG